MGKYSRFDAIDNVIYTDATGVANATRADIDEIFDELVAMARARINPVFVVACWKNAGFAERDVAEHYGARTAELSRYVRGVLRYGADDPVTRSYIRSQSLKHGKEGVRSNLFETREEALAAVRAQSPARGSTKR